MFIFKFIILLYNILLLIVFKKINNINLNINNIKYFLYFLKLINILKFK